jgi:Ca-activated chloride channel homolog
MSGLLETWTGLVFLSPAMLWLLLPLPAALWARRAQPVAALLFAPAALLRPSAAATPLRPSWRVRCAGLPAGLRLLALAALLIALARPAERDPWPVRTRGIDIVLCLDVSSSMTANDMDPARNRLAVAKDAARAFIAGRPHDRIALVTFARYPDLRCPFTLDHAALERLLDGVELVARDGPEDATGIGTAVALAARLLRDSDAASKVVILLTDGEENVATADTPHEIAPVHAAQLAGDLGVRVYTIAAGRGRAGPGEGGAALDTTQVRRLAEKTGGVFFAARDAAAARAVYAQIDALETVEIEEARYRMRERFLPFLVAAIGLFLAARALEWGPLGALP